MCGLQNYDVASVSLLLDRRVSCLLISRQGLELWGLVSARREDIGLQGNLPQGTCGHNRPVQMQMCVCYRAAILGSTFADWNICQVKIYIGAPASSTAAGTGYLPIGNLSSIAVQMRESFPSFGGVMLWDASQAYGTSERHMLLHRLILGIANNRYDLAIKEALSATGSTGFTYPACSAAAYVSGQAYTAGEEVSYEGYIWEVRNLNSCKDHLLRSHTGSLLD